MSHYTVDYTGLKPLEKQIKAVRDIREYIGEEKFARLTALFKREMKDLTCEGEERLNLFRLWTSFVGVQGYPALAWYNYCFPQE